MSYFFPSKTITFEAALRDLASNNAKSRVAAANALGDVVEAAERVAAVEVLTTALADTEPDVRAAAAMSRGDLESEAAVAPLVERFEDTVPAVRQSAAVALGRLGFRSAFEPLAKALRSGPPDLRFQAATSLTEIDSKRAYDRLIDALEDDDGEVVGAAACCLGAIGDRAAVAILEPLLDSWSRPQTRFDIAYALADLDSRQGLDVLVGFVGDKALGWDALEAIERVGDPEGCRTIAPLFDRRLVALPIRLRAAATLLALDPDNAAADRAREVLVAGLRSRKLHERGIAVDLLARVGGAWAREPLGDLRGRRGGRPLSEEIDEAITAIDSRAEAP